MSWPADMFGFVWRRAYIRSQELWLGCSPNDRRDILDLLCIMPATVMLLAWAAYVYNRWSLDAEERKANARKQSVHGAQPPA